MPPVEDLFKAAPLDGFPVALASLLASRYSFLK
jgi:hypothetical protein